MRYSQAAVELFDRAALIAKASGDATVGVEHLLAAFASEDGGLMGELKRTHRIASGPWRAAVAALWNSGRLRPVEENRSARAESGGKPERDYLTPEEAAEALGIHVQTMRAYIRNGRVPAFRVAGERAIRVLRGDLGKVLEPLNGDKKEE